jgi:hypothetical protein
VLNGNKKRAGFIDCFSILRKGCKNFANYQQQLKKPALGNNKEDMKNIMFTNVN